MAAGCFWAAPRENKAFPGGHAPFHYPSFRRQEIWDRPSNNTRLRLSWEVFKLFTYRMKGTCATQVELEIVDGVITHCQFTKGCKGGTAGLARMVVGQKADEVVQRLKGTPCQGDTSCPDQLAHAILAYHD